MVKKGDIRVGCCGFAGSQKDYFRIFSLIEIQQTFYQLPKLETAAKWREAAPPGFEFTMKAWQLITHEPTSPTYRRLRKKIPSENFGRYGSFRMTEEVLEAWDQTFRFAQNLRATTVVFQCPASFLPCKENIANLDQFFSRVHRGKIHFAWEPRGPWPEDIVRRLCRSLGLIHCVDPFQSQPRHGPSQYFRLHGIGGYGYQYTDNDLKKIKEWALTEPPSYVLFNNQKMKEDAMRFKNLISGDS
jgi:uncharacterized protein YecE (DUF72 family)